MPIIRNSEVEFTPGMVPNYMRRVMVNPERGSGAATCGEALMNPGAELPMHTHRIEEVMVITKGTVLCNLGGESYPLTPGDVILAPAAVKHNLANRTNEPAGFIFFYPGVEVKLDKA